MNSISEHNLGYLRKFAKDNEFKIRYRIKNCGAYDFILYCYDLKGNSGLYYKAWNGYYKDHWGGALSYDKIIKECYEFIEKYK